MEEIEVIAFNKKGDRVAKLVVPQLLYLKTAEEWIHNALERSPEMDGIVILVDWEKKEFKMVRYAE